MDWLSQAFEPLVAEIATHWPDDNPVQRYVDFLHHRLHMARDRGADVDNREAFEEWLRRGGPGIPADVFDLDEPGSAGG